MDAMTIAGEIAPYIASAVGAYGKGVLTKAADAGAGATVSLGQRMLQRIWHRSRDSAGLEQAVSDAVDAPQDEDFQAALRAQLKRALLADPDLVAELAGMLPASGDAFTASGERSVAVKDNSGVIVTGDDASVQR